MEATTETNQNNRELTETEAQIAIAQIQDRLMRVAKAQDELHDYLWSDEVNKLTGDSDGVARDIEDDLRKKKRNELGAKYDIPEGVHIFLPDFDAALIKKEVKQCMPHIAAFVKGKLDENSFSDLVFFFEECAECDYGWILIERPLGFYDQPSRDDMDEIIEEMKSIGTRSRLKNKKLPRIAGAFSSKP